jgi:phage gp36-like protein
MANYTTYDELKHLMDSGTVKLDQLAPDGLDPQAWVQELIGYAQDEIDGRLERRYVVPFDPTPSVVRVIARYLAKAYILNPNYAGELPSESKWVDINYRRADDLLRAIERGDLKLTDAQEAVVLMDMPLSTTADGRSRVFTQTIRDASGEMIGGAGTLEGL